MTSKRVFIVAVLLGVMLRVAFAQSADPLIGTWKINPEKSKGAKSGTTVIESAGKGLKWTVDLVSTDGKTRTTTTKGKDPKGQTVDVLSVYEKQ
jgi:hypothetical protein